MQPPPRKGNYAKFLKNLHTEQVAKLQLKNQNECELLEDIRNFIIKRSAIEKSYSEALLKISSAFLNRKIPNIPDIKGDGSEEKWNMWNVWRTVLEENEKLARARLAAVEVFSQHIVDDAKILRAHKLLTAKKCLDQLAVIQKEVQVCAQDVDKTKKLYFDEEHSAHDVRDKARDIEEKLKKKKGSFFQSITSLQKNSAKVTSKREALEEKSSGARNDYLLSLAAANAHQTRYFVVDLQSAIQSMEASVYDKVAEYLMLIARTELLTCTATQTSFGRIKEQANQLTRDYNLQCVYLFYPVLKQHIQYDFEPCDNDSVNRITYEHSSAAAGTLAKEAKRWATRITRDTNTIAEGHAKLHSLYALRDSGQKVDPNDPNGPDLDTKIDELRLTIRRAETSKAKAEARIECLRAGGVNVEEFIQEVENLSVQDLPRSASSMSVRTDASGTGEPAGSDSMYDSDFNDTGSETAAVERPTSIDEKDRPDSTEVDGEWAMLEQERQQIEQLTAGWDDPTQVDWGPDEDDDVAVTSSTTTAVAAGGSGRHLSTSTISSDAHGQRTAQRTFKVTALYNYTAQNPDELSIVENEQVEVIGEGDGDGWLRARNYRGQEGYVPHNYLDLHDQDIILGDEQDHQDTSSSPPQHDWGGGAGGNNSLYEVPSSYQLTSQISFSSVDYTVDEVEEPSEVSAGQETVREVNKPSNLELSGSSSQLNGSGGGYCIALYDYEATCPEELSFSEGEVIRVLRKAVHEDVDDGWWEGQKGDVIGLFPSLVVEECRENGEPLTPEVDTLIGDDTPPGSAPPVFTPPDVPTFLLAPQTIITQPTPVVEHNPIVAEDDSLSFSMELSHDQQMQYGSQFDGGVEISISVADEDVSQGEAEQANDCGREQDKRKDSDTESGALGVAQIVITAATPVAEDPDRSFPPPDEEEEEKAEEEEKEIEPKEEPKEEEQEEAEEQDRGEDDDQPADSAPFPISSSTGSEEDTYTGPSTAENSQSGGEILHSQQQQQQQHSYTKPQETGGQHKHRVHQHHHQPHQPPPPIPDELEPHQLARLQDLKESDA